MRHAAASSLVAGSLIGSAAFPEGANAQTNPYALDRLFLMEPAATPAGEVLTFNSEVAVANYFGAGSEQASLAKEFFRGYTGSSANMLFTRFPYLPARAHLYGEHMITPTLSQLKSGDLSLWSEGHKYSGSVNFSGITSFNAAAAAIQSTLNQHLPTAATTTESSIAPVQVSFTGSIDHTVLDVSSVSSGSIQIGSFISGSGVPAGTQITGQISGARNGAGAYSLYVPEGIISSETMTDNYGVLTVGSTSSGKVKVGQQVSDVFPDTSIQGRLRGGATNQWVVNKAQTVASQNLTMTGAPLTVSYTAVKGATEKSGFFEIQQSGYFNYVSSSITYARGAAAESLGLSQGSPGAFDSTPGLIVTPGSARECPTGIYTENCISVASFMDDLVQTPGSDQWSSFQDVYNPGSATPPGEKAALGAWNQSSGGKYTFLENWSSSTPPIVNSIPRAGELLPRAPVPEPSTWAMILLGFAGLGLARYRLRLATRMAAS